MNERDKELWNKAAKDTEDDSWDAQIAFMQRFADLIRADEREECIQNILQQHEGFGTEHQGVGYVKQRIVDAIRARSKA